MSDATMHERAALVIAVVVTVLLTGCRLLPEVHGLFSALTPAPPQ